MPEITESFNIEQGVKEVSILRGSVIVPKDPIPLRLKGLLKTPFQYLSARRDLIEVVSCHLIVNKSAGVLEFIVNERDHYRNVITGSLQTSRIIEEFGINADRFYSDKQLAKFFRRQKMYFADPVICSQIVAALMAFQAKINSTIEKNADLRGNMKALFERTVDSNVPESFIMKAPIYEGYDPIEFEVFIGAEATSQEVKFFLESPVLYELEDREKSKLLEENIKHFEEFGCAILYV